jgi:hypothetical protein
MDLTTPPPAVTAVNVVDAADACSSGRNICRRPQTKTLLVAGGYYNGWVVVWEILAGADTAHVKYRFEPEFEGNFFMYYLSIDSVGSRLAVVNSCQVSRKVFVWDLNVGSLLFVFDGTKTVPSLSELGRSSFTKNGDRIAFPSLTKHRRTLVWVLDSNTGQIIFSLGDYDDHSISSCVFTDCDTHIITCGLSLPGKIGFCRCWCAFTGERTAGHWIEAHLATNVVVNNSETLFFIGRFPEDEENASFDCLNGEGLLCYSSELESDCRYLDFVGDDTVAGIFMSDNLIYTIRLRNILTGVTSHSMADVDYGSQCH